MKNRNKYIFAVILLLILGLALRVYKINEKVIFFYDQAWISQKVYDIVVRHDIKLAGLSTDLPGVLTGPLILYFLAPIYYLTHFNAVAAALATV